MLKQRLTQKLIQKLSPQQIQLMKLLQVPTYSLEQRIKEELEINPALDEGAKEEADILDVDNDYEEENNEEFTPVESEIEFDFSDYEKYIREDDNAPGAYKSQGDAPSGTEENKHIPIPVENTFHEFLIQQLGMVSLDERKKTIALQVIGSIDDDGYLRRDIMSICDDLSFGQNLECTPQEVKQALNIVQQFEPAGVGAQDLQECLLIQLKKKASESGRDLSLSEKIITNYFDEFTKKHFDKMMRQLDIDEEDLKDAIHEILHLNPKPGSGFAGSSNVENYVIPDFILYNDNDELKITLNSKNAPDLRISDNYIHMLREYSRSHQRDRKQKEAILFIKQKIDAAKWFIDAIRQRQNTMFVTMDSILRHQYEYFKTGDETKLKPMILKDIADDTSLDISTISRVANSKFVQTEFGTFQLRSFFSESLQTDSGEEVSTREVKKILSDLVTAENKKKPLSDQKLTKSLLDKGYNIARRTVAKYREQLNIPVARLRKQI